MNPGAPKVTVVHDDTRLATLFSDDFQREGFHVSVEHHGQTDGDRILAEKPDLVILDLMLLEDTPRWWSSPRPMWRCAPVLGGVC